MSKRAPLSQGARAKLKVVDRALDGEYQEAEQELGNMPDPLDEAIYIILSLQTNLTRLRATWASLRASFPKLEDLERATPKRIARALRSGGLQQQKARTIKRLLRQVRTLTGGLSLDQLRLASDEEAERFLLCLPGLSWKSARCVMLYSLGKCTFPVDVNTFRIAKRIGVVPRDAVYRRKSFHDALQDAVPPERRKPLHVNLVVHGQRICLPVKPRCAECAVAQVCDSYRSRGG
jgi:endonuclease III